MRLRPYKPADADTILSWIRDEATFRRWSIDRYPHYPITPTDMNRKYFDCNGDCPDPDNFYPMTAYDENGILGHLILRFTDKQKEILRFGYVIVDDSRRGTGCGRQMLRLAQRYAIDFLQVKKITLGVLENNPGAIRCYRSVGFRECETAEPVYYELLGQRVRCIEMEMEP